jgi:hypothetical protein
VNVILAPRRLSRSTASHRQPLSDLAEGLISKHLAQLDGNADSAQLSLDACPG